LCSLLRCKSSHLCLQRGDDLLLALELLLKDSVRGGWWCMLSA
jgi:hypothetical protein